MEPIPSSCSGWTFFCAKKNDPCGCRLGGEDERKASFFQNCSDTIERSVVRPAPIYRLSASLKRDRTASGWAFFVVQTNGMHVK
ncbi:hypothetical protein I656_02621 [Geobacillus sp. WSUCF1]|nr:hypothetical protein I656_02621 [Geobacillus sp. WSUCF1]